MRYWRHTGVCGRGACTPMPNFVSLCTVLVKTWGSHRTWVIPLGQIAFKALFSPLHLLHCLLSLFSTLPYLQGISQAEACSYVPSPCSVHKQKKIMFQGWITHGAHSPVQTHPANTSWKAQPGRTELPGTATEPLSPLVPAWPLATARTWHLWEEQSCGRASTQHLRLLGKPAKSLVGAGQNFLRQKDVDIHSHHMDLIPEPLKELVPCYHFLEERADNATSNPLGSQEVYTRYVFIFVENSLAAWPKAPSGHELAELVPAPRIPFEMFVVICYI